MNKLVFPILLAVIAVSALLGADTAKAASIYDGSINNTQAPYVIKPYDGNPPVTLETQFDIGVMIGTQTESAWNTAQGWCNPTINLSTALSYVEMIGDGHNYAAYITDGVNANGNSITILLDTSSNSETEIDWIDVGNGTGYPILTSNTTSLVSFSYKLTNSGAWAFCDFYAPLSNSHTYNIGDFIYTSFPFNAPPNYSGQLPTTLAQDVDYKIDFSFNNTKTSISSTYTGFYTDPKVNVNKPRLINWKLWANGTEVTNGEKVCDVTLPISQPFVSNERCDDLVIDTDSNEYYLSAEINPLDGNPPQIDDILGDTEGIKLNFQRSFYKIDFTKNGYGITSSCEGGALGSNMSVFCQSNYEFSVLDCASETFPFFDLTDCQEAFEKIFAVANLDNFTVMNPVFLNLGNTNPNSCYSMIVLDDWLNYHGNLCPAFSSTIRDIVTPFVMFALGGLVFYYISRSRSVVI